MLSKVPSPRVDHWTDMVLESRPEAWKFITVKFMVVSLPAKT